MKTIRTIITCYPNFDLGVTLGMKRSLVGFAGDKTILEVLGKSVGSHMVGYEVVRGDIKYLVYPSMSCYISSARNYGVSLWSKSRKKHQVVTDCDGALFMDADHAFTPDQPDRLVRSGLDVVGAAYPYRTDEEPLASCYVAGDFEPAMNGLLATRIHKSEKGLQRCGWLGGGFMYVTAPTFSKIEYPWFRRGVLDNGDEADELGEDIGLCLQLANAGIEVFCDCDNVVGHGR